MIYIGKDTYDTVYYIDLPKLFKPYANDLDETIELFISNPFNDNSHKLLINNMIARNVLHLFIEKHMNAFFKEIGPDEETLEFNIEKEARGLFNVDIDDIKFYGFYINYNKGNSIKSLALKHLNEKLIKYQERLNTVEL